MHGNPAHCADIAHVDGDGFITDGVGWMQSTNEVGVFGKQIGTEQNGVSFRNVQNCGVVSYAEDDAGILKLFSDALDESALAQIPEKHGLRLPRCRR
jgi:hypothetical protein